MESTVTTKSSKIRSFVAESEPYPVTKRKRKRTIYKAQPSTTKSGH